MVLSEALGVAGELAERQHARSDDQRAVSGPQRRTDTQVGRGGTGGEVLASGLAEPGTSSHFVPILRPGENRTLLVPRGLAHRSASMGDPALP